MKPKPLVLHNGVTEQEWLKRFPSAYCVFALTPWEAHRLGLDPKIQWWQFLRDFIYVSDRYGRITIPIGFITDFGSVPRGLRSIVDDNGPTMLFGSAPHDRLFEQQGKTDSGRILTFEECNIALAEAQWWCGANTWERNAVMTAVTAGGWGAWRAAHKAATINNAKKPAQ